MILRAETMGESLPVTHLLTLDDWTRRFQRRASILQRGLRALFPAGVATPLSPTYVTLAMFSVEGKGDIPRILGGIKSAFNELAASVDMKEGRIITLGDA